MLSTFKEIFNPTNKDLRKRIYFTLACLAIFSLGTNIVVPGAKSITQDLGFLELLNLMSGGSLKTYSIFALGVMPYITADIIMQLLQMDIFPYFKELKEQGYVGRRKINTISRYVGIILAFIQGYVFSIAFMKSAGSIAVLKSTLILTGGTAFLVWLGDQITSKGIGNGLSLIIMAGIVNTTPAMFITAFKSLVLSGSNLFLGILGFSIFVLCYLAIIIGVIWMQLAERRIPIQYSNRTNSAYGKEQTYLPVRLNSAGVVPVIFASAIISIPSFIAKFINKTGFTNFVNKYISYTEPVGFILYILLIVVFVYFYTYMQMNPDEMSKNLNENGGYIPGIRPGKDTSRYIKQVLSRLSIVGALFLVVIAALPILFSKFSGLPSNVTIGGTGLLIIVGVAMETCKQLESSVVSRSYKTKTRSRR